jgi:hypothetical protein
MTFKAFSVEHISLVNAISAELKRQKPNHSCDTALFNKIIEAAKLIADECNRERIYSSTGMTPNEWLLSDDVGMSSKYMITVLADLGHPMPNGATPRDADDLGRCIRMVDACNLEAKIPKLFDMGDDWKLIAKNWDHLKSLYANEQSEDIYHFLHGFD